MHAPYYVVATNSGNEFMVKQKGNLGDLIIEPFNVYHETREELIALNDLHISLIALGVSREILLPVFISVLAMLSLDVYSIEVKE